MDELQLVLDKVFETPSTLRGFRNKDIYLQSVLSIECIDSSLFAICLRERATNLMLWKNADSYIRVSLGNIFSRKDRSL